MTQSKTAYLNLFSTRNSFCEERELKSSSIITQSVRERYLSHALGAFFTGFDGLEKMIAEFQVALAEDAALVEHSMP